MRHRQKAPITGTNGNERTVVPREPERAANRGIDEAACAARDIFGESDGVEEPPRDVDGFAGPAVERRELGVLPEATGKQIDLAKLMNELAASKGEDLRIGDTEDGGSSERTKTR